MCNQQIIEYYLSVKLLTEYSMSVKLLTEHHLEFLSLEGGCTCSSESTLVKMPHFWKSRSNSRIRVKGWGIRSVNYFTIVLSVIKS